MADDTTSELVPLNMEETAWLCHLLMGQDHFRAAVHANRGTSRDRRQLALYERLAAANHKLMWGETAPEKTDQTS